MGILEKEGNKIAAILSAASALAAGFSVVTMAQSLNARDKTASLVKSTDHTSASAELTGEVFIDESKPQTGNETQIPEQSASEADPELNVVESEEEQPETVPAIEMMYDQDEEVVLYDGTLPQEAFAPEEAAPAPEAALQEEAAYSEVEADPALYYDPAALEAAPVYEEPAAAVYQEAPAVLAAEEVPAAPAVLETAAPIEQVPAEAPAVEEVPAAPAVEEAAAPYEEIPAAPVVEEAAVPVEEAPVIEEAPAVEEAPVYEEVPTEYMADEMYVSDGPIAEVPIDQEIPVVEVAEEQPAPVDPGYVDPGYVEAPAEDPVYDPSVSVDVQAPAQSSDLNARIAEEALKLVDVTNGMQCTDVVALAMSNAGVTDALSVWPNEYEAMYGYATDDPQPGNLIYYNQGGNGLDHIAIYVGDGQAVHGNYSDDTGSSMTVVGNVALPGYDDYTFIQVDR